MTTKSLFIAAFVVFSAAVSALGKEEPRKAGLAVVPVKGTEIFKVIYQGETSGKVKLNIYDVTGSLIFTETLNGVDGFIRPLNFNGLQFGEYTIELTDASGKKIEKITYSPQEKSIKNIRISKIANEEKYVVSVASEGAEVINVRIYDEQNNLVHNETTEIAGNFAQVYAIKNISGGLVFQITDKAGNTKTVNY